MTAGTLTKILALAGVTGMRSMAGLATLASSRGGIVRPVMVLAAAGEMVADKTALVGDRTDPLPLGGRAMMGATVGALVARERGEHVVIGGVIGAATALLAAHLGYHARRRLRLPNAAGGLLEDALVIVIASRYA